MLLPLIAGVLLLLYAGSTLTEMFSAQRMRAVHKVQSAQAYWTAEAGLWHAAQLGSSLDTPVDFAGGSYSVSRAGDIYTALASRDGVRRQVTLELARTEELIEGEGGGSGLIDEAASAATAYDHDDDHFHIELHSLSEVDLEIESFELSADVETPNLKEIKLDNKKIVNNEDYDLPTGLTTLDHGSSSDRTIDALDNPEARIKFKDDFDTGSYTFTLVLHFTDDSSDSVTFTVDFP